MARSTRPWRSWRARASPTPSAYPFDVQMADIEFDIETYEPLAVLKPAMTRAQAEKTLDMLASAEHPVIVAGGGIVNAEASALLVELAELLVVRSDCVLGIGNRWANRHTGG